MPAPLSRRSALLALAGWSAQAVLKADADEASTGYRLATFSAEVTPPVGHPLLGGATFVPPAKRLEDPLWANGFVLLGPDKPLVLAAIDWCEIRNDAHDRWRAALAEAAGTEPQRVLVSSIHQHDAPLADLEAQRILQRYQAAGQVIDLDFHEKAVRRVAQALRRALPRAQRLTHLGLGQARVEHVASNRRYLGRDGQPRFDRSSASGGDPFKREQPEGTIDPWLKTLSFWDGDRPLCALSVYATHPMSYYATGAVNADFPGLARKRRQADDLAVLQIYASGASGNVTAGKYNDGSPGNRAVLADHLYRAMTEAWRQTRRVPLRQAAFRSVPFRLEPRSSPGFTREDLTRQLDHPETRKQCLAALGLSWRQRTDAGRQLDLPVLDLGGAQVLLLPGEVYVEYQLLAQNLRPDSFVLVLGYGECAPGYIPIERAWQEHDGNLSDWCWVAPGAEKVLTEALTKALKTK
jgi:hypothetical protein